MRAPANLPAIRSNLHAAPLTAHYPFSDDVVEVGDIIAVDERTGRVEAVFLGVCNTSRVFIQIADGWMKSAPAEQFGLYIAEGAPNAA